MLMNFELSDQQCPEANLLDASFYPISLKNKISTLDCIKERNKYKIWLLKNWLHRLKLHQLWKSKTVSSQGCPEWSRRGRDYSAQKIQQYPNVVWRAQPSESDTPGAASLLHHLRELLPLIQLQSPRLQIMGLFWGGTKAPTKYTNCSLYCYY